MLQILVLAAFAATAFAFYGANINYRSPSLHHPGMGISIRKVVKRNDPRSAHPPANLNFTHGVGSGDPYPNSVILWTRCAPISTQVNDNSTVSGFVPLYNPVPIYNGTGGMNPPSNAPVCVSYKVAMDHAMSQVVTQGQAYTSSDIDYTVKVEAGGLSPFTWYYYQFSVCDSANITSPVGRTKTAPGPDDDVSQINFAVYSCSNFPFGYFNAFGNPARKNSVDYVLHVGDYIYEYKSNDYGYGWSIKRVPLPDRTIFTLYDYRTRYASYRTDFDLLLSHQQFPWIPVWDDHGESPNIFQCCYSVLTNLQRLPTIPIATERPTLTTQKLLSSEMVAFPRISVR
jgi:alkaline phosphatase D